MMIVNCREARAFPVVIGAWAIITIASFSALAWGGESAVMRELRRIPIHETDRDEAPESREARLASIGEAIESATDDRAGRAALLTIVRFESHAAAYVFEARCSDGPRGKRECDRGRAKGVFQLHGDVPGDVAGQAKLALSRWRGFRVTCGRVVSDDIQGAFSGYGTGGKCAPSKWSQDRADHMRRVLARMP